MGRSAVRVYVRTRPTADSSGCFDFDAEKQNISVKCAAGTSDERDKVNAKGGAVNNKIGLRTFHFDHILHDTSQETVFDTCCADIIESVLEGYNGTLMAYGQTGAGKTYTVSGGTHSYQFRGLAPRAITHVFQLKESRPELAISVRVSYLEIYNETLFDLLAESAGAADLGSGGAAGVYGEPSPRAELTVMEAREGGVTVKGLRKAIATNEEEALNLLFTGETNRAIGAHTLNAQSTRSHCIFTIYLETRSRVESSEKVVSSKLHLVDLAGSERVKKTGSSGVILKEAGYINKSLTFLEQVVIALSSKNRDHVPFRSAKLTNVLRDSLGGNCETRMIANIWPESRYVEETLSTLKFATRMMCVSCDPIVNVQLDPVRQVKKLERRIRELKQELSMHDALAGRAPQVYDDYTEDQKVELSDIVQKYIKGEVDDIEISSLRQVREVFQLFRAHVQNVERSAVTTHRISVAAASAGAGASENENGDSSQAGNEKEAPSDDKTGPNQPNDVHHDEDEEEFVGELDESAVGFGVGTVPATARPTLMAAVGEQPHTSPAKSLSGGLASPMRAGTKPATPLVGFREHIGSRAGFMDAGGAGGSGKELFGSDNGSAVPSEEEALEEYNQGPGRDAHEQLVHNRAELKSKRREFKALGASVNECKREIDRLRGEIQARREANEAAEEPVAKGKKPGKDSEAEPTEQVIDEQEFALVRELKTQKEEYQQTFHKRKLVEAELVYQKQVVNRAKVALCSSFLDWYASEYGVTSRATTLEVSAEKKKQKAKSLMFEDELGNEEEVLRDPEAASFFNARNAVARAAKTKKHIAPARKAFRPF